LLKKQVSAVLPPLWEKTRGDGGPRGGKAPREEGDRGNPGVLRLKGWEWSSKLFMERKRGTKRGAYQLGTQVDRKQTTVDRLNLRRETEQPLGGRGSLCACGAGCITSGGGGEDSKRRKKALHAKLWPSPTLPGKGKREDKRS